MSDCDLAQTVLTSGLEGAGIVLLCVIAYKIYKMRISTQSKCCDDNVLVTTKNDGSGGSGSNV